MLSARSVETWSQVHKLTSLVCTAFLLLLCLTGLPLICHHEIDALTDAAMGLLFLVAVVSGIVLYAPFMRKLEFGTVRRPRSRRLRWLDLHNLLGGVKIVWVIVVGGTGVINTWADLVIAWWQSDQLAAMVAPYQHQPPLRADEYGSLQ